MIYKNGITVEKIELLCGNSKLCCHIHLSDGKVFTGKPDKVSPEIKHNKDKLQNFSIMTIAKTLKELDKELNENKT